MTSLSSMKSFTFKPFATANLAASASSPSCSDPSDPKQNTALDLSANAIPLTKGHMCPNRPDENLTPGVRPNSG